MNAFLEQFVNGLTYVLEAIVGFLLGGPVRAFITGFILLNALGYYLMYRDKKIAKRNGQIKKENPEADEKELKKLLFTRISERTLMLTALVGGSLGVLGGMYKFKHKTQKPLFKYGVPIIIGLQIIFIIWRIIRALTTKTPVE
ncbi:MAG: DUF1294 domain-containing protein [Clostridia bacterium]|nr:DUF1294 domain-containing protein [Clostridia bacterium]